MVQKHVTLGDYMKRITLKFFVWLPVALLLMALPALAQGTNLITNPGFEGSFTAIGGDQTIQVATGWSPWHVSGGASLSENVQPEYYKASDFVTAGQGVSRIRGGNDAQQFLTAFATFDGGIFQRVSGVKQGDSLVFTAFVYVWSTTFDDVNLSDRPGDVVVQVGIDPTGGTDGQSGNIVWSSPVIQYDAYNEYTATATAGGNAVTVFIRSTITSPVKSTNVYVDDTSLVVAGSTQPVSSATPTLTQTPFVPSATPTLTVTPFVPSATPTLTSTPLLPSATATSGDLGIVTPVLPSATFTLTPILPSATATLTPVPPSATFTFTPSLTPSSTSTATPTAEVLLPTNTFTPTLTLTPGEVDSTVFRNNIVHTVQRGDTVGELARLYDSSIEAIISKNGLDESALIRVGQSLLIPVRLAAPATSTPSPTPVFVATEVTAVPPQEASVYVVQPGDTLFRIAVRFNTTTTTLAQLNGIANPNVIRVGQRLNVPGAGIPPAPVVVTVVVPVTATPAPVTTSNTYVVRAGDNLYRISLRTGVSLTRLIQVNGIIDPNRLYVGQVLTIP
ncbi:MAG: LysM peptidoglycan-binding domain-containing protein [Anaerolineaceae bacterium]|nr:LysM peptidoglycan-binding domain-containing protein [Anaerolineaceae bacterium]